MTTPPFEDRRHDDKLASYRMKQLEENVDKFVGQFDGFKDRMISEFASLRKELFEKPIFVTMELMRLELESRDRILHRIQTEHDADTNEIKSMIKSADDKATSTRRFVIASALSGLVVLISLAGLILARV